MDAITAELLNLANGCAASGDQVAVKICRDAIAEVERLRGEKTRRIHWQGLAYRGMQLVDAILQKRITDGKGTTEKEFPGDCKKAEAEVGRLKCELDWIYSQCELRDGDNTHIDSDDVQSAIAAEAVQKKEEGE